MAVLSTPRWINAPHGLADAYNRLEEREHAYRGEVARAFSDETQLWLEGLQLIDEAARLEWDFENQELRPADLQTHLFLLGASASKTGLDAVLGCQYPAGEASARLALECALMASLVEVDPTIVELWEQPLKPNEAYPQSPRVGTIVKRCRSLELTDAQRRVLEDVEKAQVPLLHMSAGSHPTGRMMLPLRVEGVTGLHGYPVFSESHSVIGFKNGIYATIKLLMAVLPLRHRTTAGPKMLAGTDWYRRLRDLQRRAQQQDGVLTARQAELGAGVDDDPASQTRAGDDE